MKKIIILALVLAVAGLSGLSIAFAMEFVGLQSLLTHGLALLAFLAFGTSLLLLNKSKGIILYAGWIASSTGFLSLVTGIYGVIPLERWADLSLALIFSGLALGLFSTTASGTNKLVPVLILIFLVIIAFGISTHTRGSWFFSAGFLILALVSLLAVYFSLRKKDHSTKVPKP